MESTSIFSNFRKPSKLGSDDDLVAYLRNLERPLNEACQSVRQAYQNHQAATTSSSSSSSSSDSSSSSSSSALRKRPRDPTTLSTDPSSSSPSSSTPPPLSLLTLLDEDTRALVLRVYNEIHHREASLATHKKCSFIIEWLLYLSNAVQLLRFGETCIPYLSFMTSNRYGSHVLQTWLSLVYEYLAGIRDTEELSDDDWEAPEMLNFTSPNTFTDHNQNNEALAPIAIPHAQNLRTKSEILSALSRTVILWLCILSPYLHSILYDTSGTHILRSLIGILTGIPTHSLHIVLNNNPTNYTSQYSSNSDNQDITNKPVNNNNNTKASRTDDSQITATVANSRSLQYYQNLSTDITNTFREAYIRLVHQICNLGNNASLTDNPMNTDASSSSSIPHPHHHNNTTNNIVPPIRIKSRIGNVPIEIPTELLPPNINPHFPSHLDHSPSSSTNEELGAVNCDPSASPTIQLLLIGCTTTVAPKTQEYLCYRLINWDYTTVLTQADINGETDLRLNRDAEEKKKKKKDKGKEQEVTTVASSSLSSSSSSSFTANHWLERLCTHNIGSRVVELILRYCNTVLFTSLMDQYFYGRMAYLAINSSVCHFIIQRLLISAPGKDIVENILKELIPYVGTLYSKKKEGVIWHMIGAAAGNGNPSLRLTSPETVSNHFQQGTLSFANYNQGVSSDLQKQLLYTLTACAVVGPISISAPLPDLPEGGGNTSIGKKLSRKEREMETERQNRIEKLAIQTLKPNDSRLIQWVLDYQGVRTKAIANDSGLEVNSNSTNESTNSSSGTTLSSTSSSAPSTGCVSAIGVYTLSYLLRFQPDLTRLVVDSLVSFSSSAFLSLCMDPSMSRYIIEPLIELPDNGTNNEAISNTLSASLYSPELNWVKNKFFALLKNHFTSLACSRFGGWVITKLFHQVDVKRKSILVNEIMNDERKITGSGPGGKTFIRTIKLDYYRSNKSGWEASWIRLVQKTQDLSELLVGVGETKKNPSSNSVTTTTLSSSSNSTNNNDNKEKKSKPKNESTKRDPQKTERKDDSSSSSSDSDDDHDRSSEHSRKKVKASSSTHKESSTNTGKSSHTLKTTTTPSGSDKKLAPYMEQLGFSLFAKKK